MTPGIVAGFSRIGLVEVDAVDATNDVQANNSPFSAAIDVAPAINPQATAIAVSRAGGRHPRGRRAGDRAQHLRRAGRGDRPRRRHGADHPRPRLPVRRARRDGADEAGGSRAAAHVLFRNALREARDLGRLAPIGGGAAREPRAADQRDLPLEEVPDNRLICCPARSGPTTCC